MKSLIRFVGTSIVVAIAWAIAKNLLRIGCPLRLRTTYEVWLMIISKGPYVKGHRYLPCTHTNRQVTVRVLRF